MNKLLVFLLGLLTFLIPIGPSSMSNTNILAFEDYGYKADQYENYAIDMANDNYDKSQNSEFINKIKCNNINSNLNGIEANIGTGDSLGLGAESLEADDASANWVGNGDRNNGNFDLDCVNNNINVVSGSNVPTPPTEDEATLSVSKTVSCTPVPINEFFQSICDAIEQGTGNPEFQITPDEFTIQVTGNNNPISSTFDGSTTPVVVTLDPGNYEVTETAKASVQQTITAIEAANPVNVRVLTPVFTGDCVQDVIDPDTATGTIAAGESQTCNKDNRFAVTAPL
jgi:hypothetical protein